MKRTVTTIFEQTQLTQTITLPKPLYNVASMEFSLVSATNLVTSGNLFWLMLFEAARSNVPLSSVFGQEQALAWTESYPIPANRSDQLPPMKLYIETGAGSTNAIESLRLNLKTNAGATINPGFSVTWKVTWEIAGPDNLLSAY